VTKYDESGEWVRLDATQSWVRSLHKFNPLLIDLGEWWAFLLMLVLGIVYAIVVACVAACIRRPYVHLGERKIRLGRRTMKFEDVNTAGLEVHEHGKERLRDIELRFGKIGGAKLFVSVTKGGSPIIDSATRTILERIIEGSSIDTNQQRHALRTSTYSYPTGLSREDALAIIRTPPGARGSLPLSY
jgi:hypothetical protein